MLSKTGYARIFTLFHNYIPLEKNGPFIWTNLNPLHPRMPYAKFSGNWISGSGGEDFLFSSMNFRYFMIISS